MERSFASSLTNDIQISSEETGTSFGIIFLVITLFPLVIMLISILLSFLTKASFFDDVIEWCMELYTHGIIERLCVSTIKYVNASNDRRSAVEIPKDKHLHRIRNKLITIRSSRHIRNVVAVLFPLQGLILSLVICDKLFTLQHSIETCETYQELFEDIPIHDKACSIRPKFPANTSASEFFNPINAFRPTAPSLSTRNISDYCKNSSAVQNETTLDYSIRCAKYFSKWNNIIDTLTNALQWHQITTFIFKTSLYLTYKWQSALGHAKWWSGTSYARRLVILVSFTIVWTATFVIYLLIIIAFFKTLLSTQVILTIQTGVILLLSLFFIPLPLFNALAMLNWTICTIKKKDCAQQTSNTFDDYQNILIYAKDDEHE